MNRASILTSRPVRCALEYPTGACQVWHGESSRLRKPGFRKACRTPRKQRSFHASSHDLSSAAKGKCRVAPKTVVGPPSHVEPFSSRSCCSPPPRSPRPPSPPSPSPAPARPPPPRSTRSGRTEYAKARGTTLDYAPIGSGAGMAKINKHEVDFGASDVIASAADLKKNDLVMFPTVITGVVPVVNLGQGRPEPAAPDRRRAGPHLRGPGHAVGRPRDQGAEPRPQAAQPRHPRRRARRRLGHHVPLLGLPLAHQPRLEGQVRRRQPLRLAGGHAGRQGQRRDRQDRAGDRGLDRLHRLQLRRSTTTSPAWR